MLKSKFKDLPTVEEKEAASLEANILAGVELISQKKSKIVPSNQDYFDGMTAFWNEKLDEVATKMTNDKSYKNKVMSQFQMYPNDKKEQRGFVKGSAMQRFMEAHSNDRENSPKTQNPVLGKILAQKAKFNSSEK